MAAALIGRPAEEYAPDLACIDHPQLKVDASASQTTRRRSPSIAGGEHTTALDEPHRDGTEVAKTANARSCVRLPNAQRACLILWERRWRARSRAD